MERTSHRARRDGPDRRAFLQVSAGGAAALALAGLGASATGCSGKGVAEGMRVLRPGDVELLTAMVPAVLVGAVAPGEPAVARTVASFDEMLDDTSEPVIALVLQAFDLLTLPPTRALVAGQWSAWRKASPEDAASALDRLRRSRFALLNSVDAALSRLVASAYYLLPEAHSQVGYPGPPRRVA